MKKLAIGAVATLLAAGAVTPLRPAAAAGGTTTSFSALAAGQHLSFDPAADVLAFDLATVPAASVRFTEAGGDLAVTAASKTVILDGVQLAELATESVSFADGSVLRVGDGTTDTSADSGDQTWDLSASTKANQLVGLGGADQLIGGSGADRLVGDARRPLEHVTRMGSVGSPSYTWGSSVSADGDTVSFTGAWTGFGSAATATSDVIVRRISADTASNEHRSSAGVLGTETATESQISADGQWLAFRSTSGLVPDAPYNGQVYRSSVTTTAVTMVSAAADGTFANAVSGSPDLTDDGRFVVFLSAATNLAPGSTGTTQDVFLKDTTTGAIQRISTSLTGGDADAHAHGPRISGDGRFITFSTAATNLSATNTGGTRSDVFLFDTTTDVLTNVTGTIPLGDARLGAGDSVWSDVASHDGAGTLVFNTTKVIAPSDGNDQDDIYAMDIDTATVTPVSTRPDGRFDQYSSYLPSISADGRFVTFVTFNEPTDRIDVNGGDDIFVRDLETGDLALVSAPPNANSGSASPEISTTGRWIVFESSATNLDPTATSGVGHVFRAANPLLGDALVGGAGNDTFVISVTTADRIAEAPSGGIDTIELTDSIQQPGTWTIPAGIENVLGPASPDDLTGNDAANRIDGGPGKDTMRGSAGNDTYVVDGSGDMPRDEAAGGGTDTVESAVTWTLGSQLENLTLTGNATNGTGNVYPNVLTGNVASNRLTGASGNDTLIEKGGNDTLDGGLDDDTYVITTRATIVGEDATSKGNDTVRSAATWTLQPYLENLILTGSAAVNGAGNTQPNVMTGNAGNNVLNGDAGADAYTGGAGADQFTITTSTSVDTVSDFTVGTDRFRMRQSAWRIGDGDTTVEGATNRAGPGGFSPNAEYVVISRNVGSLTPTSAATAIGSATARYPAGARRIFVVDDGVSSQAYFFVSSAADAKVSASELRALMTFRNRTALSVNSLIFAP